MGDMKKLKKHVDYLGTLYIAQRRRERYNVVTHERIRAVVACTLRGGDACLTFRWKGG